MKAERVCATPSILKIDISPLCTLRCPTCLHADPTDRNLPLLEAQTFGKNDRMSTENFTKIIDQIRGRAIAVNLSYFGDPYAHPNVDLLCSIARKANLNVHLTTHFSYAFSDARIERIALSGLTHITIAIDGSTQEIYGRTRVGGRLDWVLSNLARLAKYRRKHGLIWPHIEVKHLVHHDHPPDEASRVRKLVSSVDIDQFTVFRGLYLTPTGEIYNAAQEDGGFTREGEPRNAAIIPRCFYPYFTVLIRYNGDVIPCCFNRIARQHTSSTMGRATIGNVFEDSLATIWNSPRFKENRRLVSNPTLINGSAELHESFCSGCERVFSGKKPPS
jgi:MoaA/NifB/PqqE/SkfB family radical SAM enzyme